MNYGRGEDIVAPNYDKEVSHNHLPLLTNGHHEVGQLSVVTQFSLERNLEWKSYLFAMFLFRFLENYLPHHQSGFLWHLLERLVERVPILFPIHPMFMYQHYHSFYTLLLCSLRSNYLVTHLLFTY